MKAKLHSFKMCMSLNSLSLIVGKKQLTELSQMHEHLKAIHKAFHVEIYIKLKPMHRMQKNIPTLYILELESFVDKNAKTSTIACPFAGKKQLSCCHGSHDVSKLSLCSVWFSVDIIRNTSC